MRPHHGSPASGIDGYAGAEDAGEVGEEGHGQAGDGAADSIKSIIMPSGGGNSYRLRVAPKGDARATKIGSNNPFIIRPTIVEEYLLLTI